MDSAGWAVPLAVLGASALLGFGVLLRGRPAARAAARGAADAERPPGAVDAEARARLDAIYAELRAQHATGGDDARAAALELEAAELLWRIEAGGGSATLEAASAPAPAADAPAPRAATIGERYPRAVGAAWGAGAVALAGALWLGIREDARPRAEGQGMTGGAPMESAQVAEAGALEGLRLAAAAAPGDVEAQNRYAHALLAANQVMDAFKVSEAVVKLAPEDAEARTHQAVVLLAIGDDTTAAKVLDRVLEAQPTFVEALGYRGAIFLNAGDRAAAIATWERAKAADPSHAAEFDRLIAMGAGGAPAGDGGGAVATVELSGEVRLAAGAQGTGTLLVYVRPEGVERGPPARALRIAAPSFPVAFSISAADAPMGGSLGGNVVVSARLDADGDPMTREEGDLAGAAAPVAVGASGIVVELR